MNRTTHKLSGWLAVVLLVFLAATVFAQTTESALTTQKVDSEEVSYGDLVTDAIAWGSSSQIALAPALTFKPGQIAAGKISEAAVGALLQNRAEKWAVVQLTGAQLRETLERSVSFAPTPRTFFLQVSGLTVVYNTKAPRNKRIVTVNVGPDPLDETAKYEVAMPLSLAQGGAGYFTIFGDVTVERSGNEGLSKLIMRYLVEQGPVNYTGQGRLVIGSAPR